MGAIRTSADSAFRDYVLNGVPGSGVHEPVPAEIRATFGIVDDKVLALEGIAAEGVAWTSQNVRVRSTANVAIATALENGDALNGVTLATGDVVFLGLQSTPSQNGLYTVVASGAASRATWADSAAELAHIGFLISEGTVGAGERYTLPLDADDITIGSTALNFARIGIEVDVAAEVAEARGDEDTLGERLDAIDGKLIVTPNVAIAPSALVSVTSGQYNVGIGQWALNGLTTGAENVAVGRFANSNGSGVANNTALGAYALQGSTVGYNVGVGHGAGKSLTTGSSNVFAGYNAGAGIGQKADAVASIGIGYNCVTTKSAQAVFGSTDITETVLRGEIVQYDTRGLLRVFKGWDANYNYFFAGAGPAAEPEGTGNIGIGQFACSSLSPSDDDGTMNTGVGYQALKACVNGADHTAFGAGALESQVSGVGNTAMGRLALSKSVTGGQLTAIGDTALEFCTGVHSTAVGYSAGIKSTGDDNTLVGVFAGGHALGRDGPDCPYNRCNAFGIATMQLNVEGDKNNLFGTYAGHALTGAENCGFGDESLRVLTTGTRNACFGNDTGWRLTTGTDNTMIGDNAGRDGSQKVDAVNSMALGANTFTEKDNQVVIGDTAITETIIRGVQRGSTYTVAGLVAVLTAAAAGAGARSFVTDASATTFNSVVAGGGSNKVPVFSDGTDWRIG